MCQRLDIDIDIHMADKFGAIFTRPDTQLQAKHPASIWDFRSMGLVYHEGVGGCIRIVIVLNFPTPQYCTYGLMFKVHHSSIVG